MRQFLLLGSALALAVCAAQVHAQEPDLADDLTELSLEDLMAVEVTSVSKKQQRVGEVAAAVYVLTGEDIRRSGAVSIPDALRLVPGVEVAQIDAHKWSISIRGFQGRFANKLLVLIDGRSVYTPLFSGVFWDQQDLVLEDIDRIEVIRGPGGTIWGANAVNGVINIITKPAQETQGTYASALAGNLWQPIVSLRHGGPLGERFHYRGFAKYRNNTGLESTTGQHGEDEWRDGRIGFRVDGQLAEDQDLMVQGQLFEQEADELLTRPIVSAPFTRIVDNTAKVRGGHLLGRWRRQLTNDSDLTLQGFYDRDDHYDNSTQGSTFAIDTADLEMTHRFRPLRRHELVWGLGYRFVHTDTVDGPLFAFDPADRSDHLLSAFVQNEISVIENLLAVTLGSKFEHNSYTGFEVQPSGRVLVTPNQRNTFWGSISRAVRTPSYAEFYLNDLATATLPPGDGSPLPTLVLGSGNEDFDSEDLVAFEAGYRVQPTPQLSLDLAAFYNAYEDLRTLERGAPGLSLTPVPNVVVPVRSENKMDGEAYGLELGATFRALSWWSLTGAYSYLDLQLHLDDDSTDLTAEQQEGESPEHQFNLRSSMDLTDDVALDVTLRYVDDLPALDVDSYVTIDARLAWRPTANVELSLTGRNLIDLPHQEFDPEIFTSVPSEVERSVFGQVTVRF